VNEPAIHEEVLGRLAWDPGRGGWSGQTELFPGQMVQLTLFQEGELASALQAARVTLDRVGEGEPDLRRAAAAELLDIHNEEWNDGPVPIGHEEFARRLELRSITFFPEGDAELAFDDGGLFEGHTVVVTVGADGSFEGAGFFG
jgi:hypothetical protein